MTLLAALAHKVAISVAVGNICSLPLMPAAHVQADITSLHSMVASSHYSAALGAEIIPGRYASAWRSGMSGMDTFAGRRRHPVEVPVSLSRNITAGKQFTRRLTGGVRHITPDRYVTVRLTRVDGIKVAFLASHDVSSSKNPRADHLELRQRLFATWRARMRHIIHRLVDERGYTAIVGGDFNSPRTVALHANQLPVINHTLMQLTVVPAAGIRVTLAGKPHARDGYTDHDLVEATLNLRQLAGP